MAFAWLHLSSFLGLSVISKHDICAWQWFGQRQSSSKITGELDRCSKYLSAYECTNDECFCLFIYSAKNIFARRNGRFLPCIKFLLYMADGSSGAMILMNTLTLCLSKSTFNNLHLSCDWIKCLVIKKCLTMLQHCSVLYLYDQNISRSSDSCLCITLLLRLVQKFLFFSKSFALHSK